MKNSVSSKVYESVINGIFSAHYKAGEILTERALIEEYGCSKTSVREALVALCQEDILRSIPRYGYEVLRVERSEITDILEYRYVLETGCLSRCLENITPRNILRLQEMCDHCTQAKNANELWEYWDYNAAFHLELIQLAGNRYAFHQLQNSLDILKRAFVQYYSYRPEEFATIGDLEHHQILLNALRKHDFEAACSALGKDLKKFAY